jgi:F0F1-type ATP synthase assembly protein I
MTDDPGSADGPNPPSPPPPPNWGLAFDIGIRLGVCVVIGLGGGLLLDNWLGTRPIFTLIGMVVGIAAAMYTLWNVARDAMRR